MKNDYCDYDLSMFSGAEKNLLMICIDDVIVPRAFPKTYERFYPVSLYYFSPSESDDDAKKKWLTRNSIEITMRIAMVWKIIELHRCSPRAEQQFRAVTESVIKN